MDLNYCTDKSEVLKNIWEIMESIDEKYPHLRFGWDGFVLMRVE